MSVFLTGPTNGPNSPMFLPSTNIYGPLATFSLDLRLLAFAVRFLDLAGVSGVGFMVDAMEGLAEWLLALLADGEALGEWPVLQSSEAVF